MVGTGSEFVSIVVDAMFAIFTQFHRFELRFVKSNPACGGFKRAGTMLGAIAHFQDLTAHQDHLGALLH
jgi:hypothetical protein